MEHGDIVGDRYRLDRKIGQGGTGSIWLAHDIRLERRVAIKFLFAHNPEHQERLAKRVALEAKIAASIQHPNVVQIFDFGTHGANIPYIAMEALSGFTLGDAFEEDRSFSLDVVIQMMSDVLRGLGTVHHVGIVHRDLKPENIFLVKERDEKLSPKLLDFGISRSLEPETRRSAVTTTEGMIIGTPQYMSPEQARGLRNIDQRTDIYSLGIVLFETLTGFVPFDSENTGDLLIQVIRNPAPPLYELAPQLGKPLCHVVDKALAKDPAQRHADAAAMHAALVAAARHIPGTLDRQEAVFPPAGVRSRIEAQRVNAGKQARLQDVAVTNSYATRASRGARRPTDHSEQRIVVGDAPTEDHPTGAPRSRTGAGARETAAARASVLGRSALRRWLLFGVATGGLVVSAVAATLVWTERQASRDDSGFIVVQASVPPALPQDAQRPELPYAPKAAPLEAQAKRPTDRELEIGRPAEPRGKRPGKAETLEPMKLMAADVARSFARQKAKVIDCLDAHPGDMQNAPQLTVRMTVTAAGNASDAQLLPEAIAGKPVSECVTRAVLSMSFPPQAVPTTFRVPLLWRRK